MWMLMMSSVRCTNLIMQQSKFTKYDISGVTDTDAALSAPREGKTPVSWEVYPGSLQRFVITRTFVHIRSHRKP